jgi:hypothetical protein
LLLHRNVLPSSSRCWMRDPRCARSCEAIEWHAFLPRRGFTATVGWNG